MTDGPRVFESGFLTLVMGAQGVSVHAGRHQVKMFDSINASMSDDGSVSLEIKFSRSHDPSIELQIEENVRLVSGVPGVTVIRHS